MHSLPVSESLESLGSLRFDNRFTRLLPEDPESRNFRRQVTAACYSRVEPAAVAAPKLLAYSPEVLQLIGGDGDPHDDPRFAEIFGGNRLLAGMEPYAMCYGGHQFGNWAGQLGDGRAINLGEVVNPQGQRWVLQLKGAGPTPYSRSADGLAVLRSSLREFICSEAMHHLGVPTTRALSLVETGESVIRDMFYDGNPRREPGAVVCRVSPSFIRFGHFEIFASRGDLETLRTLVDYTIETDFPDLIQADLSADVARPPVAAAAAQAKFGPETYARWFERVCQTTAELLVHWMRVGFVHGVMNTDNMSILGLTIDYGPYGWLEDYDPQWTPNTTDASGRRYCFGNQPQVALWNLLQLANAVVPLVGQTKPLEDSLQRYSQSFETGWQTMMAGKLGWKRYHAAADAPLTEELLGLLADSETDYTLFFRGLADVSAGEDDSLPASIAAAWYHPDRVDEPLRTRWTEWLRRYRGRVRSEGNSDALRREAMNRVNPIYVPRNYLAQLAIDRAEAGDASWLADWLEVLRTPYDESPGAERFAAKRPEWARNRAGCSMLSCSS